MNIIKIVVDGELPKSCHVCQFKQTYEMFMPDCSITHFVIYTNDEHRPESCPLVVDSVCEWHETEVNEHGWRFWMTGCKIKYDSSVQITKGEFNFCPTCGKRIKYVEVE